MLSATAPSIEAVSVPERLDSSSGDLPVPNLSSALGRGLEGLVIGIPKEYFPSELDEGIAGACQEAIERMRAEGAEIREISLSHTEYAITNYYIIAAYA